MRYKKFLINCLFIIVMLLLIFFLNKKNIIVNAEEVDYLKNNAVSSVQINEKDLFENKAFIVSEIHGFQVNTEMKYQFITYLNQVKNLRYILLEISFSSGYLLNEYLQTGDELLLKQVFSFYKGSTFYTIEEYQFYQKLYIYNQSLSDNQKLILIGIDIEHSLLSAKTFYNLYNNADIDDINSILKLEFTDLKLQLLQISIVNFHRFYEDINWQHRENMMLNNYLSLIDIYNIDAFYAQLGAKHCLKDLSSDNYQSFTYLLNKDEKANLSEKILVFKVFYKDSNFLETYQMKNEIYYRNKFIKTTYKTNNLDEFTECFLLFNLNLEASPFKERLIWYNLSENDEDKVTTDYYDYLLLVSHSKAQVPLEKQNNQIESLINMLKIIFNS